MNRKPSSQTEPGDHRTIQGTGKSETKSGEYRLCQVACPKPNSPSRPSPQRGKNKHLKISEVHSADHVLPVFCLASIATINDLVSMNRSITIFFHCFIFSLSNEIAINECVPCYPPLFQTDTPGAPGAQERFGSPTATSLQSPWSLSSRPHGPQIQRRPIWCLGRHDQMSPELLHGRLGLGGCQWIPWLMV